MSGPDHDDVEFNLAMPFVVTTSHGGPYDDDAFVAGYAAAQLDQLLQLASGAMVHAVHATARVALVPQLDLIGMRWGYGAVVDEVAGNPDWCRISFYANSQEGL